MNGLAVCSISTIVRRLESTRSNSCTKRAMASRKLASASIVNTDLGASLLTISIAGCSFTPKASVNLPRNVFRLGYALHSASTRLSWRGTRAIRPPSIGSSRSMFGRTVAAIQSSTKKVLFRLDLILTHGLALSLTNNSYYVRHLRLFAGLRVRRDQGYRGRRCPVSIWQAWPIWML